jgi:predicted O-methyltransferase YrrM
VILKDFIHTYCPETPNLTGSVNIQGWNSQSEALKCALERTKPKSIVEVGSWLGASAIYMATLTKAPIVCVDTFLGSNEVLWRDNVVQNVVQNFDRIYKQFCVNITSKELNKQIVPLPMTSSSAVELMSAHNVKVDMVYIDAGHREREVYADLQDWWPLTNKVIVGDDYNSFWPGVIAAANRFAEENNLQLEVVDSKFILWKDSIY